MTNFTGKHPLVSLSDAFRAFAQMPVTLVTKPISTRYENGVFEMTDGHHQGWDHRLETALVGGGPVAEIRSMAADAGFKLHVWMPGRHGPQADCASNDLSNPQENHAEQCAGNIVDLRLGGTVPWRAAQGPIQRRVSVTGNPQVHPSFISAITISSPVLNALFNNAVGNRLTMRERKLGNQYVLASNEKDHLLLDMKRTARKNLLQLRLVTPQDTPPLPFDHESRRVCVHLGEAKRTKYSASITMTVNRIALG
jgi:hypothetical protein